MQIAVISDTHNNVINLEKAINEIKSRGISQVIHCGDVTFSDTLRYCQDLHIHLVYGNGDVDQKSLLKELLLLNPENSAGLTQYFSLDGQCFFVAHGDTQSLIRTALASGTYDWVLQGHTHRFKDEFFGQTRWVNPGTVAGSTFDSGSFAVLNTSTKSVEKVLIKEL